MNLLERLAKGAVLCGVVVIFSLPLFVAQGVLMPFTVGKALVFRIVVDLLLAPAFLLLIRGGWRRTLGHPAVVAWGALVLVRLLAAGLGVDPFQSFWGDLERSQGMLMEIHVWLFLAVLASIVAAGVRVEFFMGVSAVVALVAVIIAVLDEMGRVIILNVNSMRSFGTAGNPANLAAYLLFQVYFALILAVKSKRNASRAFWVFVSIVLVVGIIATQTRAPTVSLAVGFIALGVWVGFSFIRRIKSPARFKSVALSIIIIAPSVVLPTPVERVSRILNLSLSDTSITQRTLVWQMETEAFLSRPLLGWGPENQLAAFYSFFDPAIRRFTDDVYDRAHNVVIDAAVTGGIFGLIAFVLFHTVVVTAIIRSFRRRRGADRAIDALLLAAWGTSVLSSMFYFNLFESDISLVLLTVAAISRSLDVRGVEEIVSRSGVKKGAVAAGLIGLILLIFTNAKPASAVLWGAAARDAYDSDPGRSVDFYERAFDHQTFANREMGKELALRLIGEAQGPQGLRDSKTWLRGADLAEEIIRDEMRRHPWGQGFWFVLSNLKDVLGTIESGKLGQGRELLEEVYAKYPQLVDMRRNLAIHRIQTGDAKGGIELLEGAAGAVPGSGDGYFFLGMGYALVGRLNEAEIAFKMSERVDPNGSERVAVVRERIRQSKNPPVSTGGPDAEMISR